MKKKYVLPKENDTNKISEPIVPYGIYQEEPTELLYDIPKEYLLQQITKAEKDIEEGRLTSHEEMKKRFTT